MNQSQSLSSMEIIELLPQKLPFIFVDKILHIEENQFIVGLKNITNTEPSLQGYSPQNPTLPSSLILEALSQTGSILFLRDPEYSARISIVASIDNATFHREVVPGDQLRLEMEKVSIRDNLVKMKGVALVDGQIVCESSFIFNLQETPSRPQIHPTASVHSSAVLGKDVIIGAFSIIGENVIIGDRTIIEANVMIEKWTQLGDDCHIHYGSVVGSSAQDIKYKGEKSYVIIGDRNTIREYVTINRSTGKNTQTIIGNDNFILTHVHIAHNCILGNNITIANQTSLAGHSEIEDNVIIGGMSGIHQFSRVGKGAMLGAYIKLTQDIPPYMLCEGNPAGVRSFNLIGLKRSGASKNTINEIKNIYKLLYRSKYNTSQAINVIDSLSVQSEEAQHLVSFLKKDSKRGFSKKVTSKESE